MLCSLALSAGQAAALADVQVPAFVAYLDPENGAALSEKTGITGWRDPAVKVSWFGELKKAGELECAVILRLPAAASAKLRLTVADQPHEVTAQGGDAAAAVSFGKFAIAKTGYTRFTLELLSSSAKTGADLQALLLSGPASEGAHFNLLPRRNAASVHLNYTLPKGVALDAFYAEAQAVEDPIHTFYMVCGFQRGYFGMQVNGPSERRIIFSVWDSGAGTKAMKRDGVETADQVVLLGKGEGVTASAFGGEGTGGHSHLEYLWKTGERQRFLLTAKPAENESGIYTGYWFHPEKKLWMLIASFRAPKASPALSHFHSFSENFVGSNGQLRRRALFGNQWVHVTGGGWSEVTEASFSHDGTGKEARLDRTMGVENGWFFLAHGGFVDGAAKYGEKFTRPKTSAPPTDLDLTKLPNPIP